MLVSSAPLRAQGTAVVPPTDLVYQDLDRLSELGVLDAVIVGQRPYSRRELARISALVESTVARRVVAGDDGMTAAVVRAIADRLSARFGVAALAADSGVASAHLDGAGLTLTTSNAQRRGFTPGFAQDLEATIDPLSPRRLGIPAPRGQSAALEVGQRLEVGSWLALQARQRLEGVVAGHDSSGGTRAELLLASARARYRNTALTAGRAQLAWSQGEDLGLFLASDAPALDQVSIASDRPFMMPGILGRLGPTQASLVYADLGASVARSHSRLLTYKVSVKPATSLELGGTFMNHFGGDGAIPSSFGNRLIDFLPFIDIFRTHNYSDTSRTRDVDSDKLLGVDARWRVPHLYGVTVAGELLIDDFDVHRIPYLLTGYGSSMLAVIVPRLGSPAWSTRVTAKHMGILTYTHGALTNGITTHGRLLGDELGPDAKSFGAELRWQPDARLRATLEARSAQYSQATYAARYVDADSVLYVVSKVSSGPNELRDRVRASLELRRRADVAIVARAAIERVRNAFFPVSGRPYAVDVALRMGL